MIDPALLIALAALTVLVQIGVTVWLCRGQAATNAAVCRDLDERLTARMDELNRLVSALLRAVQVETAEAKRAVANTELALADIARNERSFGKAELNYQEARIRDKGKTE